MLIDSGALQLRQDRWVRTDEVPTSSSRRRFRRCSRRASTGSAGASARPSSRPRWSVCNFRSRRSSRSRLKWSAERIEEHLATLVAQAVRPACSLARCRVDLSFPSSPGPRHRLQRPAQARSRDDAREFVRWADRVNADRDRGLEFEEILGYHLEQAYRYLANSGRSTSRRRHRARRSARLAGAGRRAFARGDMHAAATLFRRAAALLPQSDTVGAARQLGGRAMELGDFDEARRCSRKREAAASAVASPPRNVGPALQPAGAPAARRLVTGASNAALARRRFPCSSAKMRTTSWPPRGG